MIPKDILEADKRLGNWWERFVKHPATTAVFFSITFSCAVALVGYTVIKTSHERELLNLKQTILDLRGEKRQDEAYYENRKQSYEVKIRYRDSIIEALRERDRNDLLERLKIHENNGKIIIKAK